MSLVRKKQVQEVLPMHLQLLLQTPHLLQLYQVHPPVEEVINQKTQVNMVIMT